MVSWGPCQPTGDFTGALWEPLVTGCWGGPTALGAAPGASPHWWGLAVLVPPSRETPGVGDRRGGSTHHCPGCHPAWHWCSLGGSGLLSPFCCIPFLVLLGGGGGVVTSPSVPRDGGVEGDPSCCAPFCCRGRFPSPWPGGRVAPRRGGGGQ